MTLTERKNMLVIDASSSQVVIGITNHEQCQKERCWPSSRGNPGTLVANIQQLCRASNVPLHSLDTVLVGCGPGHYAGLRISVTVAQTLQLPSRGKVWGLCSAHALLTKTREEHPQAPAIVACGDARRNHIWLYLWQHARENVLPLMQCIPADHVKDICVPHGCLFTSPDYDRLHTRLQLPSTSHWVRGNQTPTVSSMIRLAHKYPVACATPSILYVHPPVARMPLQDSLV